MSLITEQKENIQIAMAKGAAWTTILRLSYRLIGVVSTIILARLLTPDDFGVAAIAMSIFALISTLTQFGFETVLIQQKKSSAEHYNTAWTYNMFFGLLSAIILAAASGFVGEFYNKPELSYVALATSVLFILHGARNVGVVDYQKNMTFHKEFKLLIVPKVIGFFITIALAVALRSYWALVISNLVLKSLEVAMSYTMHSFRPSISFKKSSDLFGFSRWLFLNNLLIFLNTKSPELALGKVMSPHAAAIFTLASEISKMATTEVAASLNRAIYPGYSKASGDLAMLRSLYIDSIRAIAFIVLPLGTGIALVSPFIVPLLLGDQWLEAIMPVVYLALGGSLYALSSNAGYIYFALGKPKLATLELFIRAVAFLLSMIYFMSLNGVTGVAQAFLFTSIFALIVSNMILKLELRIPLISLFALYARPLSASLVMVASVSGYIHYVLIGHVAFDLLMSIFVGVVSYVLSVLTIWKLVGKEGDVENKIARLAMDKLLR